MTAARWRQEARTEPCAPLGELAGAWVTERHARGEITGLTAERYRRSLSLFVCHVGPGTAVASIRPTDFEQWLTSVRPANGRRYRPSSLNTTAQPVRAFFGWCFQRGHVAVDPTSHTGKAKVPERPPRRIGREAVQRLIEAAGFRERTMLLLTVNLGLRLAELAGLYVEDYDRESHLLAVLGKGNRTRVLPVEGEAREALEAWIDHGLRAITGPLWPSPDPAKEGQPMGAGYVGRILSAVGDRCGVKFTPHQLRHTAASDMIEEGIDLAVVQAVLGHRSLSSTTVYVTAAPEHLRGALAGRPRYGRPGVDG